MSFLFISLISFYTEGIQAIESSDYEGICFKGCSLSWACLSIREI